MSEKERLLLDTVERKVCDIASGQLGIRRDRTSPPGGRGSFRRGRLPVARGRRLGFRCVSLAP
jgi:hypothetical protein